MYIEEKSIVFDAKVINFKALSIFSNNPYFSKEICEFPLTSKKGSFANGEIKIIGSFQIVRKAEPFELVSWIDDIN